MSLSKTPIRLDPMSIEGRKHAACAVAKYVHRNKIELPDELDGALLDKLLVTVEGAILSIDFGANLPEEARPFVGKQEVHLLLYAILDQATEELRKTYGKSPDGDDGGM